MSMINPQILRYSASKTLLPLRFRSQNPTDEPPDRPIPPDTFQPNTETYHEVVRIGKKEYAMFHQILNESLLAFHGLLREAQEKNPDFKALKITTEGRIADPPYAQPQVEVFVDEANAQKTYQLLSQLPGVNPLYQDHPPVETMGVNRNNVRQFTWAFKPIPEIYEGTIYTKKLGSGWTDPIPMPPEEMLKHIEPYPIRLVMRTHGDAEKRAVILQEINDGLQVAMKKMPGAEQVGLKVGLFRSNSGQDEIYIRLPGKAVQQGNQILNLGLPGYAERYVSSRLGRVLKPRWMVRLQRKLYPQKTVSGVFGVFVPRVLVNKIKPLREKLDIRNGVNHVLLYDSKKIPGFTIRINIQDDSLNMLGG